MAHVCNLLWYQAQGHLQLWMVEFIINTCIHTWGCVIGVLILICTRSRAKLQAPEGEGGMNLQPPTRPKAKLQHLTWLYTMFIQQGMQCVTTMLQLLSRNSELSTDFMIIVHETSHVTSPTCKMNRHYRKRLIARATQTLPSLIIIP